MSLNLNSNEAAPKITFNTSKVTAGVSINLTKKNPNLKRIGVRINWIGSDLDICSVGKDSSGNAILEPVSVQYKGRTEVVPADLLFYMNMEQAGIKHGGDLQSSGDIETEQINVATQDLKKTVTGIDFIVTSHVEKGAPLMFKDVEALEMQIVDLDSNEVVYSTDLDAAQVGNQTGVVFAEFTKANGEWSYVPVTKGIGNNPQGVQNVLDTYYA